MTTAVDEISIPDSKIAREITELVRDTESPLLFHHSSRVYHWGALAGKRKALRFDPELLYAGAMFHDMGLTHQHKSEHDRFEVDGANAARDFFAEPSFAHSAAGRRHGLDSDRTAHHAWDSATYGPGHRAGHRGCGNGCAGNLRLCRLHASGAGRRSFPAPTHATAASRKSGIIQAFTTVSGTSWIRHSAP